MNATRHGRAFAAIFLSIFAGVFIACGANNTSNDGVGEPATPTLYDLVVTDTDDGSITLAKPVFSKPNDPFLTIDAYIGIDGNIAVNGETVSNAEQGPVAVTAAGYTFSGLNPNTGYRIIVVAHYDGGYSVRQIAQNTTGITPVLNSLSIADSDTAAITLAQPTLSTAGNPLPQVEAYIGENGTITVSGSEISGAIEGPVDVSEGDYTFQGLNHNTVYRIIVRAQNSEGYDVMQIVQSTEGIAPVLNNLAVAGSDTVSLTLDQPTFAVAGNPAPTVLAYLSAEGNTLQGPIDVSAGEHQFTGLAPAATYRIIVVAQNRMGFDIKLITHATHGIAPVMDDLAIAGSDSGSITLSQPTFSTAGNPAPAVKAYVGPSDTIAVSGSTVTGASEGEVDVATGNHRFAGLNPYTSYKIIVVASNSEGYAVKEITQSTAGIAPVLNNLSIANTDSSSISLSRPTFATAGNPAPTVRAYIGVDGEIAASGAEVSNALESPVDVSTAGCQFSGLDSNVAYRIIVVAENSTGYSVKEIAQATRGIAPVLDDLVLSGFDAGSITLSRPTLSTAGNPAPAVRAYLGWSNTITVSGSTVSGAIVGNVDVSTGGYQFSVLNSYTSYKVIVVASNSEGYSVKEITQSTAGIAPVMNSLSIAGTDSTSITLSRPTFSTTGNPAPTVSAYIGLDETISVEGAVVSNALQGPCDASSGSRQFSALSPNTLYRIIVVAQNVKGYSVQQIAQATRGIAPVLNNLAVAGSDSGSITLSQPTFATAGNPAPEVKAYIGPTISISVSGSTVTGATEGDVNVANGGYQFSGLSPYTSYRIIVVASNSGGYSVKQISQSTAGIAPVLDVLSIAGTDSTSITLSQPTFSTAGNPAPSVCAYIGIDGTISVSGNVVSNWLQGTSIVSSGGRQFTGLSPNIPYRIIVVAQNVQGYSVQQIAQATRGVAPVLNNLAAPVVDTGSICLSQPTFATAGNPAPTVKAYIGPSGSIAVSGSTVTGATEGDVNVATGGYQFAGLTLFTSYKIIVVASNNEGYSVKEIVQNTAGIAPVMNRVSIAGTDSSSITLSQPTFSIAGNSLPTVSAYIGLDGTVSVSGSVVSDSLQGPIDVSTGGYQFSGMEAGTRYRIIVVAWNEQGVSVQAIVQSTGSIKPEMNELTVTNSDATSVTLGQPTFSIAGNPLPTVKAYIGLQNNITVSGSVVSNALAGPINVAGGGYQFNGLNAATAYKIIVVAENGSGYSVQQMQMIVPGTVATRVYGQGGRFTLNCANPTATGFKYIRDVAIAANGVYIADTGNNRVFYYEGNSTTPTRVYGQRGNFSTNMGNNGGVSADSLNYPHRVAVDAGGVYIVDSYNHRVLYYEGTSTTASRVYGQGGSFSTNYGNKTGINASSLNCPIGIAVAAGGIYIADYGNHRILYYEGASTTASRVYGQADSLTSGSGNNGGVTAGSLYYPQDVAVDAGGVYIADCGNHRILYYEGASTTATRVYGQGDSYNMNTANYGGLSANSLLSPYAVVVDAGGVYIVDCNNNRVLYYEGANTTASRVYGQGDSFTTGTQNKYGITAAGLALPMSCDADGGGVYIADYGNNRVLYYEGTSTTASRVYGQEGSFTTRTENINGMNANSLSSPNAVAVDAGGVYVADTANNRVLFYPGNSVTASRVYGQGNSFAANISNNGGISANSLANPYGVTVAAGGVFIADYGNHRVLYYAGISTTASRVYGQGDSFTTNAQNKNGITAGSLYCPFAVAVDAGGVFIADYGNHRVLYYEGTSTTASRVYGQGGSFTTNSGNRYGVSANSLYYPKGIAVVEGGVYISDCNNNRVLYYEGSSTIATRVYGQNDSFLTSNVNNGGMSARSLNYPYGIAADAGGLYVADCSNYRVLYYAGVSTTASRVYGQGGYLTYATVNNGGISANSISIPAGIALYAGVLYVVDNGNNRVLSY